MKTKQLINKEIEHNGCIAQFTCINRECLQLSIILFILLSLCDNYHISSLSLATSSCCCCRGPLLKYCARYGWSRHCHRFHYLTFDTLGRKLLCCPLLRKRYSWRHLIRRCRFSEWDVVNVLPPNATALVLPRLFRRRNHCLSSLLLSSFAAILIICNVFCYNHRPDSLYHLF